jgi:hypothetical protein
MFISAAKLHHKIGMRIYKVGILMIALLVLAAGGPYAYAAPAPVPLLSAGNYVILAGTAITTTGATHITGDIAISAGVASSITGFALVLDGSGTFSTSSLVTGKVYASDYSPPTPATLTTAVNNMGAAYVNGAGRVCPPSNTEGTSALNGQTLATGVYCWTTNLAITGSITLSGSSTDVWIFQVPGTMDMMAGSIILSGGALPSNVFWVVGGQTTLHPGVNFQGIILDHTSIAMQYGATIVGRLLAGAAVTMISNGISTITGSVAAGGVIGFNPAGVAAVGGEVLAVNKLSVLLSQAALLLVVLLVPLGYVLVKKRNKVLNLIKR